jgi:cytochrome c-type biogenesis protein CcmH/NrfG
MKTLMVGCLCLSGLVFAPAPHRAAAPCNASQLKPDDARAHYNLGNTLAEQKKLKEAVAAYKKAIQLKPDFAEAYLGLGRALRKQKKLDEAVAASRKAIALKPDFAEAYNNLGLALYEQKKLDEAVAAFRQVLKLDPTFPEAHFNLGNALREQKKLDEAVAAYRQAIRLRPAYPEAYNNLGVALAAQKKLTEAVAAFRKAIRLKPDYPEAHFNLGITLTDQKKLEEAVAAFKKAAQLLPDHAAIRDNLRRTERWLELDRRLPALLTKKDKPRSPQERLDLAAFCIDYKRHYAAAVGFFREAFAAEPKLAGDLRAQHRYRAASAAVRAAAGQGADARDLSAEQRDKLRQQALDWLRADFDAHARLAEKGGKAARQAVQQRLSDWLQDADLDTVRDVGDLAALPEEQRKGWQKLWVDVALRLKKCQ